MSEGAKDQGPRVEFQSAVLQKIRQHARSSMEAEICGVLIGEKRDDGTTRVDACIAGEGASQGGAHVTFTQGAWEHIYRVKDEKFPELSIIGWYHSHPGFGIFLSDYDLFIHENFFGAPHQIAWVFDPHSEDEGCFGWVEKKVRPLSRMTVLREDSDVAVGDRAEPDRPPVAAEEAPKKEASSSPLRRFGRATALGAATLLVFLAGAAAGAVLVVAVLPRVQIVGVIPERQGPPLSGGIKPTAPAPAPQLTSKPNTPTAAASPSVPAPEPSHQESTPGAPSNTASAAPTLPAAP